MSSKRQQRRAHWLRACYCKVAYDTPTAAVVGLGADKTRVSYQCAHCGKYHNGHPMLRPNKTEKRHKGTVVGTYAGLKNGRSDGAGGSAGSGVIAPEPEEGVAAPHSAEESAARARQRRYWRRRPTQLYWLTELARWADDGGMVWPDEDVMYGPGTMGFD